MQTTNGTMNGYDYDKSLKKNTTRFLNKFIRVERYINRPLASLIVRMVFNTRVTPNGLTYASLFLGLLAAFFFSRGEYLFFVLGGISIQLSSIVDCSDGMLARAKDMCSEYGSHLDIFFDRIVDFTMLVGISMGLYNATQDKNILLLGLLTSGLYLLQINLFYIVNTFLKKENGGAGEARALFLLVAMILSIAGRLDWFIYGMLAETVINILARLFYFISLGHQEKK